MPATSSCTSRYSCRGTQVKSLAQSRKSHDRMHDRTFCSDLRCGVMTVRAPIGATTEQTMAANSAMLAQLGSQQQVRSKQ